MGDVEGAVRAFEKKTSTGVLAGFWDLSEALVQFPKVMTSCKASTQDVEHIVAALKTLRSPEAFAYHAGEDLLVNPHDIFVEISTAVSDWRSQSFKDFGVQVGTALRKVIFGEALMSHEWEER